MKYQYFIFKLNDGEKFLDFLNKYGNEGYKFVQSYYQYTDNNMVMMEGLFVKEVTENEAK